MRDDARQRRMPALPASDSLMTTSAAAPSEIELELAAVTVPSLRNAGFSCGILLEVRLERLLVVFRPTSPCALHVTATISFANAPSRIASCARVSESIAYGPALRA